MKVTEAATAPSVAHGRAAQLLELKRNELDLAVQLGHVRTVPGADGGRRRVAMEEIERLRASPDFPAGLRERVRTVGTAGAAELLSITGDRFTKLARTGHFSPVAFYLNRYRAVVWLYVAGEVLEVAERHPQLLTGRLPVAVRTKLGTGQDVRSRNWRARRLGVLLRQAEDAWAAAAAIATLLPADQVAEVVGDPYERAHLARLRPRPVPARPESLAARDIVDRLLSADDPDEILWYRMSLALAIDEARELRPAPRPDDTHHTAHTTHTGTDRTRHTSDTGAPGDQPSRGPRRGPGRTPRLLTRLRLGRRRAVRAG
ncbi:DUF6397 family protein [Streptomyces ficellus]|uniref:DUF6397 family protein n=1 Tax=Streptomyces ficellus TaxID=1977088 RepID=UPI001FCC8A89|nr:DUF6397 family protein [Streptomyces ficellus]